MKTDQYTGAAKAQRTKDDVDLHEKNNNAQNYNSLLAIFNCLHADAACLQQRLAADSPDAESSMDLESQIELVSQLNTPVLFGEAETTFQIDECTDGF